MSGTDSLTPHLKTILDNLGTALLIISIDRKIIYVNQEALKLTGYEKNELVGEKVPEVIFALFDEKQCSPELLFFKRRCEYDVLLKRKDGKTIFAHMIASLVEIDGISYIILNFIDLTEKKELEKKLYEASITDYLTGLYNRRFMIETLHKEKEFADRYKIPFTILILDIDFFKLINDLYGHDTGDRVLVEVARVLKTRLRASDLSCRWGGEEFLVLLRNTVLDQAKFVGEKLRTEIEKLTVPPVESVTVSIGGSQYYPVESLEETIKRADLALLKAKAKGKNCVIFFEE